MRAVLCCRCGQWTRENVISSSVEIKSELQTTSMSSSPTSWQLNFIPSIDIEEIINVILFVNVSTMMMDIPLFRQISLYFVASIILILIDLFLRSSAFQHFLCWRCQPESNSFLSASQFLRFLCLMPSAPESSPLKYLPSRVSSIRLLLPL